MGKNDKKPEEKMDNKAQAASPTPPPTPPPTEATAEPAPTQAMVPVAAKPTILERFARLRITVPTAMELDKLEPEIAKKREALTALGEDASMPPAMQASVKALVDLANPVKPGMEEVTTVWSPARVLVHQPTSNDPKKPESSKLGNMYSTAGQLLESPLAFIPFYFHEENVNFEQGKKVPVCSSPDGKVGGQYGICEDCLYLPFGKQNGGRGEQKKTDCNAQLTVAMLSADLTQIYLCQFSKTSRSAGAALMALAGKHPFCWKQSYLLSTEKKTGDLGIYWIFKIEPTGKDNSPEACKIAKALNELYAAERKRLLGTYYYRVSAAPLQAAQVEAAATVAGLSAGLDGGGDAEVDLSTPGGSSVKSATKPM